MKRIQKRKNKFIVTVLFVFVAFFIWQSVEIMAKYYATKNNKGVAVASGLYFNSDKLNKKTGVATDIDNITADEIEGLAITTNTASWSSGSIDIPIKIQNYESNILYNDYGLDISYRIQFKLLDVPVGATYAVIDKDGTSYELNTTTYETTETLYGGSLDADTYKIRITLGEGGMNAYDSARVLILAYPTAPDYLVNDTNQQYRLLGIIEGYPNAMKLEIESAGFLIEKEFTDDNWKEKVQDSVTYIYNIKTKGDIIQDSNSAAKREIIVKWRSEFLNIDQYNEYYLKAIEENETAENYYTETDTEGIQWSCLKIKVLPYTNIKIAFYKTEAFNTNLGENGIINSKEEFVNLVKTELVTE
ncbi:MAG: hypothetical protein IJA10_00755 [Lachnospiraceae bacterium]|nr:hypothetical protein [Lachnospiraceae bacterium]